MELVKEIEEKGFVVDLITMEVGSRGFVNHEFLPSQCHTGSYEDTASGPNVIGIRGSYQGIIRNLDQQKCH